MELKLLYPHKTLNKAYRKLKTNRPDIDRFKENLIQLLDSINTSESEEFHKNLITDFLKKTYYDPNHFVNTKGRNDLVVHNGKDAKSTVGVIIETKSPSNKAEMLTKDKVNTKAFQELILYYLRERETLKNLEIKNLIATNIHEWFVFDAAQFEKNFAQNKSLVKQFKDFEQQRLSGTKTDFFYKEIAEKYVNDAEKTIEFTYFDLRKYNKILRNDDLEDDKKLLALYKLLSPEHLLKLPFANDSNSLDKRFYGELLHIIGLDETKDGGKKVIKRFEKGKRSSGSLLENAINQLDSMDKISRLDKPSLYGETTDERLFNVGLELCITWINRILFLKLLEAQLRSYHKGDATYGFLSSKKIHDYDDMNALFFQVLAKKYNERSDEINAEFGRVPYLNSSLFEPTEIEHTTLFISNLRDDKVLPIYSGTVLKNENGKTRKGDINAIEYLFEFLNAYDFSSEGSEDIQEDSKTLINASVLGLIFEKINGYKDGSFFTPGFITMYMCRETIRRAVVQKFNETNSWNCQEFDELHNKIEDSKQANEIVNSIKICDPAVGSGHFLVSALNEMIAIKHELKILQDRHGKRLKNYSITVENDELIVEDEDGELFAYNPKNKETQRIQETLFHEKQTIIENCLFGVDINPNSVKICRLRLWIELLKNAYYKNATELETLPNIDINIKSGNSLISRFDLDADLGKALKKSKWTIDGYRIAVDTYRNAKTKEEKHEMERLIESIKGDFRTEIALNDPKMLQLNKKKGELINLTTQTSLFDQTATQKKKWKAEVEKLTALVNKSEQEIDEIKSNKIYENAFEWRFEFPEVLDDEGKFVGFDVVIGNPPYIRQEEFSEIKAHLKERFKIYHSSADLLTYFVELSNNVLRSKGYFQFIISGKFTRAGYGVVMRKFLSDHVKMTHFIDFAGKSIFDEATVDAAIIGFKKATISDNNFLIYREVLKEDDLLTDFYQYIDSKHIKFPLQDLNSGVWSFDDPKMHSLIEKLQSIGTPLINWEITINFGLKTGYNEAFIIDDKTKSDLTIEDSKAVELIKPLLRGRDIQKYYPNPIEKYVITTFPSKKVNIDEFQSIKNYLNTFGKKIHQTGEKGSRKKTSHEWYETQDNIAFWQDFEKPKLIWKRIGSILRFCYDESGAYCLDSTCIATGDKVKFLSAVLNSKLINRELFRLSPKTGTGDLIISVQALNPLPVPIPNNTQEAEICNILDQILTQKAADPKADTSVLEAEIDQLVYALYGLTEEEIGIVENS